MSGVSKDQQNAPKRNSEARREQNRAASRNYRLKRKQKLALLDKLINAQDEEPNEQPAEPLSSDAASGTISRPVPDADDADATLIRAVTNHGWSNTLTSVQDAPVQRVDATYAEFPFGPSFHIGYEAMAAWGSLRPEARLPSSLTTQPPATSSETTRVNAVAARNKPGAVSNIDDDPLLSILGNVRHLSMEQKRDLLEHLRQQVSESVQDDPKSTSISRREQKDTWMKLRPTTTSVRNRLQIEAHRFAEFIQRQSTGQLCPAQLTRLFCVEAGFFSALFVNCYALGMADVEPLMVDEGVSIFSVGPETGYDPSLVPMLRERFNNLTPDLRPCDKQLTIGHHPYVDVLPFRGFRERTLQALTQDPPLIDEEELCRDLTGGGMVCWGSQQNSMGMEAGVPWDLRSWEVKPWFLKKWYFLVGGWEDEMWESTRWWHRARDEKLPDRPVNEAHMIFPTSI